MRHSVLLAPSMLLIVSHTSDTFANSLKNQIYEYFRLTNISDLRIFQTYERFGLTNISDLRTVHKLASKPVFWGFGRASE